VVAGEAEGLPGRGREEGRNGRARERMARGLRERERRGLGEKDRRGSSLVSGAGANASYDTAKSSAQLKRFMRRTVEEFAIPRRVCARRREGGREGKGDIALR